MKLRTPIIGTVRFAYHTGGHGNAEIVLTGVTIGGKPVAEDVTLTAVGARPEDLTHIQGKQVGIYNSISGPPRFTCDTRVLAVYRRDGLIEFIPF